jgi:formylglycine-generating enzyme required for sulfatase activity
MARPGRADAVPIVFISSTSEDLKLYRAEARDAAISAGFLPVMMEYFVASGRHPPLGECLAKVDGADMLVAIVAHRYGWKPPEGGGKSITWLECERAASQGQEVLAFLVDDKLDWPESARERYRIMEAYQQRSLTPELLAEVQQDEARVAEFKQWLNGRGIRKTFGSTDDLRGKVDVALREWRQRHHISEPPPRRSNPRRYLEYLREQTAWIDIRGLQVGTGKAHRFPIEDLYIPLTTSTGGGEGGGKRLELEDALAHRRLVIVGEPGAGKTTFLRRIVFALCEAYRADTAEPGQGVQCRLLGVFRPEERPFPLLIRIAELAEHIQKCRLQPGRPGPAAQDSPEWLIDFLKTRTDELNWGLPEEFFRERLGDGSCILLLDGLDEAPGRLERESVARLFENATHAYSQCRFVVTTRPLAYAGQSVLAGFQTAHIEPLETEAIRNFLRHWCQALFPESTQAAEQHLAGLSEALQAKVAIRRMARNPVMLTALAVVHWNERRLPEQRADLYESILNWLARTREQRPGREPAERCLVLLSELALAMQDAAEGRLAQTSKRWAAEALAGFFAGDLRRAEAFVEQEEVDSGIIVSRGSEIRFWHLIFQEYLSARAIAGKPDAEQHKLLLTGHKIYKTEWRETALLLAGVLVGRQGLPKVEGLIAALFSELGERPSLAAQARCAGLLGTIVRDLQPLGYQPTDSRYTDVLDAALGIFDAKKAATIEFQIRLEAAEALGQAGDPRLPMDQAAANWVTIEGGEFRMGAQNQDATQPNYDPQASDDEGPVHCVYLDAYQIARYPVTVQEYQRFVEAEGYQDRRWWNSGGFGQGQEPAQWDEQLLHPNRPVVNVSWCEASAYCAWAGVRLPSEAEWERAARGFSARKYPWGNENPDAMRANYSDGGPGHPTPVGLYPAGATPEGVLDLAGNVWEWVEDWFAPYGNLREKNPSGATKGEKRVWRGGSWKLAYEMGLRAADRSRTAPDYTGSSVGFRCVREVFL